MKLACTLIDILMVEPQAQVGESKTERGRRGNERDGREIGKGKRAKEVAIQRNFTNFRN